MKLTYDRHRYFAAMEMDTKLLLNLSKQNEKSLYFQKPLASIKVTLAYDVSHRGPNTFNPCMRFIRQLLNFAIDFLVA